MLTLDTILKDTIWIGKFYTGGRMLGTYEELSKYDDEFRDLDISCQQPEHLQGFYDGYSMYPEFITVQDYYQNVYMKEVV